MKNLEKLRKIIIKEIPEIVELKFGCEFLMEYHSEHKEKCIVLGKGGNSKTADYAVCFCTESQSVSPFLIKGNDAVEIIGRPIRLSDVLRTINNRNYFLAVSATGAIYNHITEEAKEDENGKNIIWNLEKDNLNDQSPETIEFLYKILKA